MLYMLQDGSRFTEKHPSSIGWGVWKITVESGCWNPHPLHQAHSIYLLNPLNTLSLSPTNISSLPLPAASWQRFQKCIEANISTRVVRGIEEHDHSSNLPHLTWPILQSTSHTSSMLIPTFPLPSSPQPTIPQIMLTWSIDVDKEKQINPENMHSGRDEVVVCLLLLKFHPPVFYLLLWDLFQVKEECNGLAFSRLFYHGSILYPRLEKIH